MALLTFSMIGIQYVISLRASAPEHQSQLLPERAPPPARARTPPPHARAQKRLDLK